MNPRQRTILCSILLQLSVRELENVRAAVTFLILDLRVRPNRHLPTLHVIYQGQRKGKIS